MGEDLLQQMLDFYKEKYGEGEYEEKFHDMAKDLNIKA
jgi:hypothetical protein